MFWYFVALIKQITNDGCGNDVETESFCTNEFFAYPV